MSHPLKPFHRLPTDLGPPAQSGLFGQGPSRLTQISLFGLLCPPPTVLHSSLLAWNTPWPLSCVLHVANVFSPIACQNNSYSPFKTHLRHGPFVAAHSSAPSALGWNRLSISLSLFARLGAPPSGDHIQFALILHEPGPGAGQIQLKWTKVDGHQWPCKSL